jgi:putative PIN family toxin of toxin-antitoxin system
MRRVVLDTNIIVSALWSPHGNPAKILAMLPGGYITPYYDFGIMCEYKAVLTRPKFKFSGETTDAILEMIERRGYFVTVPPSSVAFADESDRKFYDVARFSGATLITGNTRHYPNEPFILSPSGFLARV